MDAHPGMRLWPQVDDGLGLRGVFAFIAQSKELPQISDEYKISIRIPPEFPREIPNVTEIGKRIPNDGKHHRNSDGTLCLGTPLRLLHNLAKDPTLMGFSERCLIPYLYAMSLHLCEGISFVFGELDHGAPGEWADYAQLLRLATPEQAREAICLLGFKKRHANKMSCPCGCGGRVGICRLNRRLAKLRPIASRSWFRNLAKS